MAQVDPCEKFDPVRLDWPWWIPWMTALIAAGAGVEAIRARATESGSEALTLAIPMIVLAVLPLVLDALAGHPESGSGHPMSRLFLPRLPWAALMIAPVVVVIVDSPVDTDFAPFILVLMCIQVGAVGRLGESVIAMVAASGSLVALELSGQADGALIWVFGNFAAWAGGMAVQKSLVLVEQEKARHAEQMAGATLDERRRIAREVHDVVAHSLSVTMLHLTGARHALESGGDPAAAANALRDAERLGREAMNDIRRTVGLLAGADDGGETAPMPSAGDILALAREFASAGLAVECKVHGDPANVSTAAGLGLYRIAQESLANAAKHAPGAAVCLALDVSNGRTSLVVRSTPSNGVKPRNGDGDGVGLGLRGMEERARLLGGTFRAGPEGDGWSVAVEMPANAEALSHDSPA